MKRDSSKWTREEKKCENCNKLFYPFLWRKQRFCCASCARYKTVWNKGKKIPEISGENHYLWKKDRTEIMEKNRLRQTVEWKKWREKIFLRDLFTCQECGKYGEFLEPHHIVPIRSDRSKLFDTKNGITLCRPCHQKTIWKESDFAEKYSALVVAQM